MDERQKELLKIIITEYIKTAQPVSSKFIFERGDFDVSSATIRNEMAELENQGYIYHPHTSAGRVPTEKGYQFYITEFIGQPQVTKRHAQALEKTVAQFKKFEPQVAKELAKQLAVHSNAAVFVAFSDSDFYYTGLSNLFSQPEFTERQMVHDVSQVIDHLDTVLAKLFDAVASDVKILVGRNNPFGSGCGTVLTKYDAADLSGLLGIIGPMRMNYHDSYSLLKYSQHLINKF